MRQQQVRFQRRKLELEMQMSELETKHHLLEEDLELERKVKRKAIENDDVHSQSTCARDKSRFNWTTKKRDILDYTSRIDNRLALDRSTSHNITDQATVHQVLKTETFPQSSSTTHYC